MFPAIVLSSVVASGQKEWPQGASGKVQIRNQEKVFHGNGYEALEHAAQRSGGVTIPWKCSKYLWMWHLRTWLSDEHGAGCMVEVIITFDDLKGLFNHNNSTMLWFSPAPAVGVSWAASPSLTAGIQHQDNREATP